MDRKMEHQPVTAEEGFEDVGLDDQKQHPRRRGFFSKFSETQEKETTAQPAMSRFLTGRKRGQSGQGSELGQIDQNKGVVTSEGQTVR
jgi:hypothetical protein